MPRGNGSGPRGEGPKTGRGAGYCSGNEVPGYVYRGGSATGRGLGRGFGRGSSYGPGMGLARGFRGRHPRVDLYGFQAFEREIDPETEMTVLRHRADILRDELEAVDERIRSLGAGAGEDQEGSKDS